MSTAAIALWTIGLTLAAEILAYFLIGINAMWYVSGLGSGIGVGLIWHR